MSIPSWYWITLAWGLFEAPGTLYQHPVPGHPDPQGRRGALGSKIIIGGPLPDAVACVMPDIPVQDSHIPRIQDKGPHIFCQGRLILPGFCHAKDDRISGAEQRLLGMVMFLHGL